MFLDCSVLQANVTGRFPNCMSSCMPIGARGGTNSKSQNGAVGAEKNAFLSLLGNSRCRRRGIHLKAGHDPAARVRMIERGFDRHLANHPWKRISKHQQQKPKGGKCRVNETHSIGQPQVLEIITT